jgi:hypothetical protein
MERELDLVPIFESIYKDYIDQISRIDFLRVKDRLGVLVKGEEMIVPVFGMPYAVSSKGIFDPDGQSPSHGVSVVICKYLLMAPENEPVGSDWVAYRDFKDAAPFVGGFRTNVEQNISRAFSGRVGDLEKACRDLSADPPHEDFPGQLVMRFSAFPRLPILLLFNDEDEEFPAQCSVLFERRAEKYLDMECLAISGWILAEWLKARSLET